MRSQAKASSAGSSISRRAVLAGVVTAFAMVAFLVSSASGAKEVVDWFGTASGTGSKGGDFNLPRDPAVNNTGAGGVPAGTIYVADDNNNRVQRFSPAGAFVSAWGANVLTPPVNEVQTLTVSATGGTYALTFDGATTAPLAHNADASAIQTALLGLSSVGSGLSVGGTGPFTITFSGKFAATNVAQIAVDDNNLSGSASTAHPTQGNGAYEVCAVAANCRAGTATGIADGSGTAKNGVLDNPQSVAVDGDTGNVYVSDRDNRRVNQYSATGTFIRSFGFGADASVAGAGYEVCPAANRCTTGVAGAGAGQVGSTGTAGTLGIAVSTPDSNASTGTVFLADSQNRRVNTYNLDGTSPGSFGSATQFGTVNPRKIAVDSRGIVYASDSSNVNEIDRYDTLDANGGGVGFLSSIAAGPPANPLLLGPASTATSGLAVDPDSDGGGSDEDVLYVLRDPTSGNTVVQQFGPVNDPGLTTAPTAVDDTHGSAAGFTTVQGLGLDDVGGRLLVSTTTNVSGVTGNPNRVYILDDSVAPAATLDPITDFDAHSATFTGTADPNGALTGYRFEYVDDAEFLANGFTSAAKVPIVDASVGDGDDPVAVENLTPDDLVPGTLYHVRLVAKQTFAPTQTIAGPLTFTTDDSAPSFLAAASVTSTDEATLRAAINPENEAVTDYHFQWGTSTGYGNTTPVGSLSSGPVAVSEDLTGLTPGQTYHYRLLATNGTGTTTGPDRTFTTPAGLPQFPERAYEVVSQLPTGGIPFSPSPARVGGGEDGDQVTFFSPNPLPGGGIVPAEAFQAANSWIYTSVRGDDGWQIAQTGLGDALSGSGPSGDGAHWLATADFAGLDPDDQNGSVDIYQRQPDGSIIWISRDPRIPVGTPQTVAGHIRLGGGLVGGLTEATMTSDGHTVVFASQRRLLDADTSPSGSGSVPFKLYKWTDGQLSFIGVRPDGSVPTNGSWLGMVSPLTPDNSFPQHAVSRDGRRVAFTSYRTNVSTASRTIYVQTDGEPTVEAVKETGVAPLPSPEPFNVFYRDASLDASRVFYTSASRLTPDSGARFTNSAVYDDDLYVYDIDADEARDLTPRLDGVDDPAVDPASADRARVLGTAAVSEDGKRAYFVADARYNTAPNPQGELPSASGRNLYLAELDDIDDPIELRFVATLGAEDEAVWQYGWANKAAYASSSGSVFAFGSSQNLTGQDTGGSEQVFVYDAVADTLVCASCPSDGSLPAGSVNATIPGGLARDLWQYKENYKRWVSTGGSVFFDTPTSLLAADQNSADDVYEYRDGSLRLISAGAGGNPAKLENASRDGSSVFFSTVEALVPQDDEPGISKLYVARVDGGFPFSSAPPDCDLGAGACEGAPSAAGEALGAGTSAFSGPPNPNPVFKKRCPSGKRKVRRKGRTRCIAGKHHGRNNRNTKHNRRAGR